MIIGYLDPRGKTFRTLNPKQQDLNFCPLAKRPPRMQSHKCLCKATYAHQNNSNTSGKVIAIVIVISYSNDKITSLRNGSNSNKQLELDVESAQDPNPKPLNPKPLNP